MPVVAVIGAQWGDEGKGHIVDMLAERSRLVIRYGGGNNAGHTVVNRHGTFKLHIVPSGVFDPGIVNIIGSGVVVDPAVLLQEIADLEARGITTAKLFVSDRAHVIMPYHVLQDQFDESLRGDAKIGTTGRGIGPAYADKMMRIGIRMGDLLHEETLLRRLHQALEVKNRMLTVWYGAQPLSLHETFLKYLEYGNKLERHVTDVHPIIQRALDRDLPILLEGAQGGAARHRPRLLSVCHIVAARRRWRLSGERDPACPPLFGDRRLQGIRHPCRRRSLPDRNRGRNGDRPASARHSVG